jgi:hypothetical protein
MACAECTRLAAEQERLERTHAAALDAAKSVGVGLRADNARLRIAVNRAWLDAEYAKLELQEHMRGHSGSELTAAVRLGSG